MQCSVRDVKRDSRLWKVVGFFGFPLTPRESVNSGEEALAPVFFWILLRQTDSNSACTSTMMSERIGWNRGLNRGELPTAQGMVAPVNEVSCWIWRRRMFGDGGRIGAAARICCRWTVDGACCVVGWVRENHERGMAAGRSPGFMDH